MIIKVKSIPENFRKEVDGSKPNTVRFLDGNDLIQIENTETHTIFEAPITDITTWKGAIIISYRKLSALSEEKEAKG